MGHRTAVCGRSPIFWLAVAGVMGVVSIAARADDIHTTEMKVPQWLT
jgi:hypothetical protein